MTGEIRRVGIDLGGTKIEGVTLDASGDIIQRIRVATPQHSYDDVLAALSRLIEQLDPGGNTPVGIGTPGATSPASGLLRNANSVYLNGQPFVEDMQEQCARDVRIANDANCFTLSEARDGAAAGAHVVFGVILGTGVGGGLVVDGRVLAGTNAIAGEWGHNPLPWPDAAEFEGPACYCGKLGCIETWLSGPGLARDHRGLESTGEAVAAAALTGDKPSTEALERYHRRLAKSLASVINLLDPDVIVLGGGLSNIASLYEAIPPIWTEYVFSDVVNTRLVAAMHGDSSGVRGAAWLWD